MTRRFWLGAAVLTIIVLAAWGLSVGLERLIARRTTAGDADDARAPQPAAAAVRHITATLYYGSEDGQYLVPVPREVPYGEGSIEQGRHIVASLLAQPAPSGLVRAIPEATTLRSFYVTERGEAFVDLGPEIVAAHPGGSVAELFTVYAIVNAVTANLPAITRVQILIGGKEVDTLAGHVDLRRPLERNDALLRQERTQ